MSKTRVLASMKDYPGGWVLMVVVATALGHIGHYLQRFAPGLLDAIHRIGRRGKMKRIAAQAAARDTVLPMRQPPGQAVERRKAA